MARAIYLIEKIWMDNMENHNHTALGYDVLGYIEGEDKAINFCNKGKTYTSKDCWAIWQKEGLPEFRFSKLENLLGEKIVKELLDKKTEEISDFHIRNKIDTSNSGMESMMGSRWKEE